MRSAPLATVLSVRVVALGFPETNPQGWPRTLGATALELSAALWGFLRIVNSPSTAASPLWFNGSRADRRRSAVTR
jgi:hypothetical protein